MNTLQHMKFRKKFARSSFHTQEITQGPRGWISFESHSSRKRLKRGLHDLLSPLDDCEGSTFCLATSSNPIFRVPAPPICHRGKCSTRGRVKTMPAVRPGSQMLASWRRLSVRRTGNAQMKAKDAFQLADGLRKSKGTVRARHN